VPIGCFLGGFPPPLVTFPATRLEFLRATWLTTSGSSLVVATRFYPGARKTFRSSWQAFRLQLRASIASANRSAFTLSQSLATPFADPFVGLKDRNLRDAESYTEKKFPGQIFLVFCMFYFQLYRFQREVTALLGISRPSCAVGLFGVLVQSLPGRHSSVKDCLLKISCRRI